MYEKNSSIPAPMSFHRLFKKPLDDTSVFYSMRDLVNYVKTGAVYNGQKITLISSYGNFNTIRNFTIYDKMPIIDLAPSEHVWKYQSDAVKYMLIYNRYNPDIVGDITNSGTENVKDYNKLAYYSIMDIVDLFSYIFSNNYSYKFLFDFVYIKDNKWHIRSNNKLTQGSSPLSINEGGTNNFLKIYRNTEELSSKVLFTLDDPEGTLLTDFHGEKIPGKYEIMPQHSFMDSDNPYTDNGYSGYISSIYMMVPKVYSDIVDKYNL